MPISRGRRARSRRTSAHRTSAHRISARRTSAGRSTRAAKLREAPTEEKREALRRSLDAAAQGDASRALAQLLAAGFPSASPAAHQLRELVELGVDAPGWMYSRWVVDQTYRRMLVEEDPSVLLAVATALSVAYPEVDPMTLSLDERRDLGNTVAGADWLSRQLAVFEHGGLREFLDERAGPFLLKRADRVWQWCDAEMDAYRLLDARGDRLVAERVSTGEELELVNLGALTERDAGVRVLGRVVPVSVEPGLMFESRPVEIDRRTAKLFREPDAGHGDRFDWLDHVEEGRLAGRIPPGFSLGRFTPFSCDLEFMGTEFMDASLGNTAAAGAPTLRLEEGGRTRELLRQGLSAEAANGVAVCELVLTTSREAPRSLAVVGSHLAAVLVTTEVYDAAQRVLCKPELAEAWELVAEHVPEPVRSRCRHLATLSRAARAAG